MAKWQMTRMAGGGGSAGTASRQCGKIRVSGCQDKVMTPGKYYLADAGFAIRDNCLVPYQGVRYHLREWDLAGNR